MDEPTQKRVDESWKEQAEREKRATGTAASPAGQAPPARPKPAGRGPAEELPEARFDLFISGLAMEALIALGDMAHPVTRKQAVNLPHAKYLIDLLGVLEEKTKGNLTADEGKLFTETLYQVRMRYLAKAGPAA